MNEVFSTIAVFQYSSEDQIIGGRFEAEGIGTFLADTDLLMGHGISSEAEGGKGVKQKLWRYWIPLTGIFLMVMGLIPPARNVLVQKWI